MIDSTLPPLTNNLDDISLVGDMVVFRGYSRSLRAEFSLLNNGKESVFVGELPIEIGSTKNGQCFPDKLLVNQLIEPGCPQKIRGRLRFPVDTSPGHYSGSLTIGEKSYKLLVEVNSKISISITPSSIEYQGVKPGQTYKAEVVMKNTGNTLYTIQNPKHSTMLDYDYLCKAASFTILEKEKKQLGFMGFLDGVVDTIHSKYAKSVDVSIDQKGHQLKPGEEIKVHVSLTMPKDIDTTSSYAGNFRIGADQVFGYTIFSL